MPHSHLRPKDRLDHFVNCPGSTAGAQWASACVVDFVVHSDFETSHSFALRFFLFSSGKEAKKNPFQIHPNAGLHPPWFASPLGGEPQAGHRTSLLEHHSKPWNKLWDIQPWLEVISCGRLRESDVPHACYTHSLHLFADTDKNTKMQWAVDRWHRSVWCVAVAPGFVRSIVACCRMAAESPNLPMPVAVDSLDPCHIWVNLCKLIINLSFTIHQHSLVWNIWNLVRFWGSYPYIHHHSGEVPILTVAPWCRSARIRPAEAMKGLFTAKFAALHKIRLTGPWHAFGSRPRSISSKGRETREHNNRWLSFPVDKNYSFLKCSGTACSCQAFSTHVFNVFYPNWRVNPDIFHPSPQADYQTTTFVAKFRRQTSEEQTTTNSSAMVAVGPGTEIWSHAIFKTLPIGQHVSPPGILHDIREWSGLIMAPVEVHQRHIFMTG